MSSSRVSTPRRLHAPHSLLHVSLPSSLQTLVSCHRTTFTRRRVLCVAHFVFLFFFCLFGIDTATSGKRKISVLNLSIVRKRTSVAVGILFIRNFNREKKLFCPAFHLWQTQQLLRPALLRPEVLFPPFCLSPECFLSQHVRSASAVISEFSAIKTK